MSRWYVANVITVSLISACLAAGGALVMADSVPAGATGSSCGATVNPVACENSQPGTPEAVWDISGYGDPTIQGFATDMSANAGSSINFKISTNASAYTIEIYRLGYYAGDGARHVATVSPSASLPQVQPACATNPTTSLYDCGTWAVSASWAVPSSAVSGVYLADLTRRDTGGVSQITFVVRNDSSTSDIVYQTSDETWEAYNRYGGSNFYTGSQQNLFDSPTRARAISYNRPFITRGDSAGRDFLFSNEYPTIRFLERNGYDVSYLAGVDTDRYGATLLQHHKVFLSVGHDEYWSQPQLTNVTNARDAGVHLMFLSGNEVYWHTRFASSIDGTNTAYRTLICYKETWDNSATDPSGEATATWRDPRFATTPGGSNPENSLTGTMYKANSDDLAITVTKAQAGLRIWRNTGLASMTGASTALAAHTVGYESDEDVDNGFRPAGQVDLSTTVGSTPQELTDFGVTTAAGTTTHHLTLYRATSGALVFGAGTIQWGWGLDGDHDGVNDPADSRIQQATVNVFADMGVQPQTVMSGLSASSASTDTTPPASTITSPAAGSSIANGTTLTVSGTATDVGGSVAGVEVSLDAGASWHEASGTTSWSYTGILHGVGALSIESRATDDSLNTQSTPTIDGVTVTCPCSLFGTTIPGNTPTVGPANVTPSVADSGDGGAYELGTSFKSTTSGQVTGIRFYKSVNNTGTHTGALWTASGIQLATGTFTNETASGWQTLTFASPVSIASNTSYVASYWDPNGHYSDQPNFSYYSPYTSDPLTVANNTVSNGAVNGLFASSHSFPTGSYQGTNYFVDVNFVDAAAAPPAVATQTPAPGATAVAASVAPTATFSKAVTSASIAFSLADASGNPVTGSVSYDSSSRTATFSPTSNLAAGTQYTATVSATDTSGRAMSTPATWTFTTAFPATACPCTILGDGWSPTVSSAADNAGIELGVKFAADTDGVITGVRFYKGIQNTGTHLGSLWTAGGALLATATFSGESASGWQTATFATPVSVTAGTTYIAGYHTNVGYYATTSGALSTSGIDNFPLHVPVQGAMFSYSATSTVPTSASSTNYGVDVIFTVPSTVIPTVTSTTPANTATGVDPASAISATYSTSVQAGSPSATVTASGGSTVAGTVALNSAQNVLTFTPSVALAPGTNYSVLLNGARSLSGTLQQTSTTVTFTTASSAGAGCPCTLFGTSTPATADSGDTSAVTVGVKFTPSVSGFITGVRFYKSAANTGTHVGTLWTQSGTQLATITFTGESGSGWQTANLNSAVAVTAGTTYVVSYLAPNGHYANSGAYFASSFTSGPLTAPSGANGVYSYGSSTSFPASSYNSTNYWVDAVFTTVAPVDITPPTVTATSPAAGAKGVPTGVAPSATFSEPVVASSVSFTLVDSSNASVSGTVAYSASAQTATFTPGAALATGGTYTASVSATDTSGNAMTAPRTWSFTVSGTCPCTLFASDATPAVTDAGDPSAVNLGVKFTPSQSGYITGVRFYKSGTNTGVHVGTLWSATGTSLASATFTGETASGWQTVTFGAAVAVTAGVTYVASYSDPNGHYSVTSSFFASPYTNGPLTAPAGSNGVYAYGSTAAFPASSYNSTNYWVDVVFSTTAPVDTTPPTITAVAAAGSTSSASVTWTTDEVSSSRVDYGTSPTALTSSATTAGLVTAHSVALVGLTAATTYYYRVASGDAAGNSAMSPASTSPAATFTTPAPPPSAITDTTATDFGAGSVSSTYVGANGDGEVVLNPAVAAEFSGTTLPSTLVSNNRTGGSSTVSGGFVKVLNADLTTRTTYASGRSIETLATLSTGQTIGFVTSSNSNVQISFSVNSANALTATTNDGVHGTNATTLAANWTAAPHTFRIEWTSNSVAFYLDNTLQVTRSFTTSYSNLRPQFSDPVATDAGLVIDWMRMGPYAASGTFTSRVFDAGTAVNWGALSWDATVPAGTTLTVQVRTGNTATPDTSWSAWVTVPTSGNPISRNSRYLQYKMALTSTGSRFVSPAVRSVTAAVTGV